MMTTPTTPGPTAIAPIASPSAPPPMPGTDGPGRVASVPGIAPLAQAGLQDTVVPEPEPLPWKPKLVEPPAGSDPL